MSATPPTILIADDHRNLVQAVERLLADEFEVVGCVYDGEALVREAARLSPDVLLVDIAMPILSGLQALRLLVGDGCAATIVMLTSYQDPSLVEEALEAGATGYVTKDRMAPDLIRAIRSALEGRTFVSKFGT